MSLSFKDYDGKPVTIQDVAQDIDSIRINKLKDLGRRCEDTILGYFQSTVNGVAYYFSNDNEAQKNFDKGETALSKGYATTVDWTCYDMDWNVVRLNLDNTVFENLYKDHLNHIQINVAKFRDILQPKVELAYLNNDIDGIRSVVW